MSECAGVGAQGASLAPTPTAYIVRIGNAALKHRPIWSQALAHSHEPELVTAAERGQVGHTEGNVEQVKVFQMGS